MSSAEQRARPASEPIAGSITELFHRLNRVLPDSQQVLTMPGEMLASQTLELMREHGYSQVPVVVGTEVLGLFSHRSFSEAVLATSTSKGNAKIALGDFTVEKCLEKAEFARVTDEFKSWFDTLDERNAVLVGEAHRLQGWAATTGISGSMATARA